MSAAATCQSSGEHSCAPSHRSAFWDVAMTERRWLAVMFAAILALAGMTGCTAPNPVDMDRAITLTLVRHGQSEGNLSGRMDTSVPGPPLTDLGSEQAVMIANRLSDNRYDGIFASTMIRTQQTAEPMAHRCGEMVTAVEGLQEIEAGVFEGQPEAYAVKTYYGDIVDWTIGNRDLRIPGSIDGNEFDDRFDRAIDEIYATGVLRPIVYSHGAAIAAWATMNAENSRPDLMKTAPLPNTGYVVLDGKPGDWKLVDWNGTQVP